MRRYPLRDVISAARRLAAAASTGIILVSMAAPPAAALSPGDPAPGFRLPFLTGEDGISSGELWEGSELTALVIWNRDCPHCTQVAMGIEAFTDSLESMGMTAVGIVFGPDDRAALEDLLWDRGINVTHLWDEHGAVAAAYGLGIQHLGVFLIDRAGTVQAAFDHRIADLFTSALPAAREWKARAADPARAAAPVRAAPPPEDASAPPSERMAMLSDRVRLSIDARARILSTEGAKHGDLGLYREELEPGALFLHRWDLRMHWSPRPGIEVVPWLRVSNEPVEALKEGPEQITEPRGSLSIRGRAGRLSGTLGVYPLVISPLLLQRWDDEDAPPLGGVSGCGVCGAGASGMEQKSLEILEREYFFEGLHGAYSHRWGRLSGWFAVPRWEVDPRREPASEPRYRRLLYGSALELGRMSNVDAQTRLARPLGLRVATLWIEDDRRTVPFTPILEQDEQAWMVQGAAGPLAGVSLEGEVVWFNSLSRIRTAQLTQTEEREDRAHRIGLRGYWTPGSSAIWMRLHHLRTGEDYSPYYRALTYDANREGWRLAAGYGLRSAGGRGPEIFETTLFLRRVEEVEPESIEFQAEPDVSGAVKLTADGVEETTIGLSLIGRPWRDLVAGAHLVRMLAERQPTPEFLPGADPPEFRFVYFDERGTGVSFDLQWEAWPTVTPLLRVDRIRRKEDGAEKRDYWQGFVSVRVVM